MPPATARGPATPKVWLAVAASCVLLVGCELRAREPPFATAPKAQRERGRVLLAQYQCGSCHAIPEVAAARGHEGPALTAFGRRIYIAGHLPNRPETLARWIVDPTALVPGTPMPAMGVHAADARDMAAYLLALE